HHGIESGHGERRHTEVRIHDDGLRLIVIARQAKTVGQLKSSQLSSPRIVELASHSATLNGIPILVSRPGPGNCPDPSVISGIVASILAGYRHRSSAIDLDGHSVHERSPNAKRSASIAVRGRAKWLSRARPQR